MLKATAVALATTFLAVPVAHELRLGLEADTQLTRSFEAEGAIELNFAQLVDGEEQETDAPTIDIESSRTMVIVDRIEAVTDGAPTRILREYRDMTYERVVDLPEETIDEALTSPLEGESVVFRWDADDDSWSAELPPDSDSDLDQETLDDLRADLDLVGLLPDDEVEVGDSWDVGLELYLSLNWVGGLIPWNGEDDEQDPAQLDAARQDFANAEAEGTATLTSVDEDRAIIHISLEGSTWSEVELDIEVEPDSPVDSVRRESTTEVAMDIEVTWDLTLGRWTHFEISDVTTGVSDEIVRLTGPDGQELELTQRRTFASDVEITATNE
ncbi:MAG: hypothetical protein WD226_05355 [Planctomycetota bacterium]